MSDSIALQLKTELWDIERLIPYVRNPRKNDAAVDRMAAAIREFGFRIPILAKSDGTVIDGHLRLKAALKLQMKKVPVAPADDLTDAQIKAFRLLVNKSAEWAEWDNELLDLEFTDLMDAGVDLALTGFDLKDVPQSFPFDESLAPEKLPAPEVSGDDSRTSRFILVYRNDSEKELWMQKIGIDGKKVVYSVEDLNG